MLAGALIGLTVVLWPTAPARQANVIGRTSQTSAAPTAPGPTASLRGTTDPTLALPIGVTDVDLAAIPDRLLNDPPAARLRVPVFVRGTSGIASVDPPYEISWTEAGYWYWMRSARLSVSQLIDLASALR